MFDKEISRIKDEMIELRRDFHRHPELGFQEKRTSGIVAGYLKDLGLEVLDGIGQTGVIGILQGKDEGKTVMLRADMDALPIQENNEVEYRSVNNGIMHACGHDGHIAMLLGTAKVLSGAHDRFSGSIKFVFQPAEERLGGARAMIEGGVLENPKVDAAFGLHLISLIPIGYVGLRDGPIMASMDSFYITIKGQGGHSAMPEGGVDAILISAQVITALQGLATKEFSPITPVVVHVGTISGGDVANVIAEEVKLSGTVRCLDQNMRKLVPERMERILAGITSAHKGGYELDYQEGYPVTMNDPDLTVLSRTAAEKVVGEDHLIEVPPTMASEDMSFYLQKVPGCYFYVGAGNPQKGFDQPHHNSRFDFDEGALEIGASIMTRLALDYLRNQ